MELLKYKHNIFNPKFSLAVWGRGYTDRVESHSLLLKLGTYWKPIAKLIRYVLRKRGYSVKLRGRGDRTNKYHNYNRDIMIRDSVFLAVYARKMVNPFNVKL